MPLVFPTTPCFVMLLSLTMLQAILNAPVAFADESAPMELLVDTLNDVDDPAVLQSLMRGMLKGLEGRRNVAAPGNWIPVATKLQSHTHEGVRNLAHQLAQIFGDSDAIARALTIVADTQAAPARRRQLLQILLARQNRKASHLLSELLDDPDLQLAAIRGYAAIENTAAPDILLNRYPTMAPELRRAVVETLATRTSYARALLNAVRDRRILRTDIPTHVARSLHALLGERFISVFGKPPALSANREQQMARWKARMTPEKLAQADASHGRRVFRKTCAACHLLYGEGGKIGPDLTGANRASLDYLLLNSVDPSYDVPEAYRMVSIVTVDGRVVNGVVAEEDAVRVILKTVEDPRLVIAATDIEERIISPKSMMPDGQLEALKLQEVFDLIKYLQTTEQVELAP